MTEQQDTEFKFPQMTLADFSEEQIPYLEMLSKYSGRKSKLQIINTQSVPLQKETFVKEHFTYLDINEQVDYNDLKDFKKKHQQYSYYFGIAATISLFSYYAIVIPTARSLVKETVKSSLFGVGCGYGYYKVRQIQYQEKLHNYYIMILNRVHDKRRFQIHSK